MGVIFLRGTVEQHQLGKEVAVTTPDAADAARLADVVGDFCRVMGLDVAEVLSVPFVKLFPYQQPARTASSTRTELRVPADVRAAGAASAAPAHRRADRFVGTGCARFDIWPTATPAIVVHSLVVPLAYPG